VVHEFKERKNMQIFKSGFGDAEITAVRQKVARDNAREDSENPFPPHRDIHPRNILLLPQPSDHARKVVLVDFGLARTSRSPFPEWEEKYLPGAPISPMLRWIKPREWFDGWIDWDWKAWAERHYEHTRGSITEYMQMKWGPKDRRG